MFLKINKAITANNIKCAIWISIYLYDYEVLFPNVKKLSLDDSGCSKIL